MRVRRILKTALGLGLGLALGLVGGCGGAQVAPDPVAAFHPETKSEGDRIAEAHQARSADEIDSSEARLRAERLRRHEKAHRRAALTRHEWHEEACADVVEEERGLCPLGGAFGDVRLEEIPGGVRVFAQTDDPETFAALVRHARCHVAHGAHFDRTEMADCPFYVRDVEVRVVPDEEMAFDLIARSPESIAALRDRARTLVAPAAPGGSHRSVSPHQ